MTAPAAAATTTTTTTWKIDPAHSSIEFSAKHLMITTVKGRFAEFEGTVTANEQSLAASRVDVTIKAASIDTRTEQRDAHLRSADFLDVEHFPEITFRSTGLAGTKEAFTLTGDLTIHGVTKPVTLDVTFEGEAADPWGGHRAGFVARGKIDRRDFGLVYNQVLEAGALLVSNEIKLNIDVQVIRG